MTYIIIESCIKCKYTDCVEVCPVDCFHEGPNYLVIKPECPIDAIVSDEDIKEEDKKFLEINERLSKKWPVISQAKDAPSDAKEWENKKNKLELLEE